MSGERVASVREIAAAIVRDAMPATKSGQTCFVPKYQLDALEAALSIAAPVGDEWRPIESAPDGREYVLVWDAEHGYPIATNCKSTGGVFWEGDWDRVIEASHWKPIAPPALSTQKESDRG